MPCWPRSACPTQWPWCGGYRKKVALFLVGPEHSGAQYTHPRAPARPLLAPGPGRASHQNCKEGKKDGTRTTWGTMRLDLFRKEVAEVRKSRRSLTWLAKSSNRWTAELLQEDLCIYTN